PSAPIPPWLGPPALYAQSRSKRLDLFRLPAAGGVTHERDLTSALESGGQGTLVEGAVARNPARHDLAVLAGEGLEHADVFIVHHEIRVRAETADFLAAESAAETLAAAIIAVVAVVPATRAAVT